MALSGSFSGSVNKGYQKIRIDWVGTQSIANNTTTITAKMYLITGPLYVGARASSITIGGDLGSFTAPAISTGSATTIYLGSVTKTITHNSDGTKAITMSALYNIRATLSGTYYENITASSGTITLDTIPRASAITAFNDFTIGDGIPIALDRKVTSFTHDITLKAGDVVIATRTGIGTSYTLTLDTAEQDKIYALIPSSNSITVTLYCDTKSGTTKIGSTQTKNATANVGASIIPTFTSITATEQNANVTNIVGSKFVQSLSSIKFAINGATGVKGSTIKSYKIEFNGVSYSESYVTVSNINKSGNIVATATVTDSRGKTATKTLTVNLLPYSAPAISAFTVTRYNFNDKKIDPFGTFAMIRSVGSVSSIINSTEKNSITYKLYYRERGGTTWILIGTPAASGLSLNATDIVGTFDITKAYDIKLDVTDKFKTTSSVLVLSTAKVTLSWDDIGVGVAKVRENGVLDVGGDIYENGVKLGNKYSPIHSHPYVTTSEYTALDILAKLKTVDSSGSGLDADLFDGLNSSSYDKKSEWAKSSALNGYVKLPNGIIIQWGTVAMPATEYKSSGYDYYYAQQRATFPIAFPNSALQVYASCDGSWGWANGFYYSNAAMDVRVLAGIPGYCKNTVTRWLAVGY